MSTLPTRRSFRRLRPGMLRGSGAGPFKVTMYEGHVEIKRWHLVDGEPGDLTDGLACSIEDAVKIMDALDLIGVRESASS